jgi:hypothetical protein
MEKEFLTYERALALKELGFDDECMGYFKDREFKYCLEDELVKNSLMSNSNSPIFYTTRPLKSQVFRWFREKYNQNSFIELVYQDGIKYDYVLYVDKDEEECENFGDGPFKTYEEAENACIDELIEIAKQQDNG